MDDILIDAYTMFIAVVVVVVVACCLFLSAPVSLSACDEMWRVACGVWRVVCGDQP